MYSRLTVGDGLVSQIPAVIIATSAGFLTSKASSSESISRDLLTQFLSRGRPLALAAGITGAMVFLPGFPKLPFAGLAAGLYLLYRQVEKASRAGEAPKEEEAAQPAPERSVIEEVMQLDRISVEVGHRLIPLIDPRKKAKFLDRIAALRRQFGKRMGLVLPLVRLRDNIDLAPDEYVVKLYDQEVGRGKLSPGQYLAMDPGTVEKPIRGQQTTEPVYGLPAIWINESQRQEAELSGYTVIDPESVLLTHLSEVIKRHAHELLSREDVQDLVDHLREQAPAAVNSVVPEVVSLATLQGVLEKLLKEGIPIRNLPKILEVLAEQGQRTKSVDILAELVRKKLARTITQMHADASGKLNATGAGAHRGDIGGVAAGWGGGAGGPGADVRLDSAATISRYAFQAGVAAGRDRLRRDCNRRAGGIGGGGFPRDAFRSGGDRRRARVRSVRRWSGHGPRGEEDSGCGGGDHVLRGGVRGDCRGECRGDLRRAGGLGGDGDVRGDGDRGEGGDAAPDRGDGRTRGAETKEVRA